LKPGEHTDLMNRHVGIAVGDCQRRRTLEHAFVTLELVRRSTAVLSDASDLCYLRYTNRKQKENCFSSQALHHPTTTLFGHPVRDACIQIIEASNYRLANITMYQITVNDSCSTRLLDPCLQLAVLPVCFACRLLVTLLSLAYCQLPELHIASVTILLHHSRLSLCSRYNEQCYSRAQHTRCQLLLAAVHKAGGPCNAPVSCTYC